MERSDDCWLRFIWRSVACSELFPFGRDDLDDRDIDDGWRDEHEGEVVKSMSLSWQRLFFDDAIDTELSDIKFFNFKRFKLLSESHASAIF